MSHSYIKPEKPKAWQPKSQVFNFQLSDFSVIRACANGFIILGINQLSAKGKQRTFSNFAKRASLIANDFILDMTTQKGK